MRTGSGPSLAVRIASFAFAAVFIPQALAQEIGEIAVEPESYESVPVLEAPNAAEKPAPPKDIGAMPGACACDSAATEPKGLRGITPVRIFPRLGNFFVPPKGPGYYSLADSLCNECRKDRPKFPYSPIGPMPKSFFDSDFRYLDSPKNKQHDIFDPLHEIYLGNNWLFSTGGEVRWRLMNEGNSRLTAKHNNYNLYRTRVYGDLWYQDKFRVYVEFLDAHSFSPDLPPLPIDVDRADLLNAFVDVKVGQIQDSGVYARLGRQELHFGSERLISTLDWANTRRTFQGARLFTQGKHFDLDLFWVQPVIPDPSNFDRVDSDVHFGGAWLTYRPKKGQFVDFYYLFFDDDSPRPLLGQATFFDQTVHTAGVRCVGDKNNWLWDFEAMLQFGERGDESIFAGAATIGGGYHFAHAPWNPTFWLYYDYASGDQNPDGGDHFSTFNQLFPFGHYYLGWADAVGRQNIHDANAHLFLYPSDWITVWLQYHHFELASRRDALYNAGGVPVRRDPTGRSGGTVGDEIDVVLNFHMSNHTDILLGYSHLFGGEFLQNTGPVASTDLFFAQFSMRW